MQGRLMGIRYVSLVAYVVLTLIPYAILIYDVGDPQVGVMTNPVTLLGMSLFVVSRMFLVLFWFTLLPAWLLAVRMQTDATRYFLLWAGYLAYFLPVWLSPGGDGGAGETLCKVLSVASTVMLAGAITVLIRKLEGKSRNPADGGKKNT